MNTFQLFIEIVSAVAPVLEKVPAIIEAIRTSGDLTQQQKDDLIGQLTSQLQSTQVAVDAVNPPDPTPS